MDEMVVLRGLAVRADLWPARLLQRSSAVDLWRQFLVRLGAHAAGDQAASRMLAGMAGDLTTRDPRAGAALTRFLALAPDDAAYIAGELGNP